MHDVAAIRANFEVLRPFLDERRRRLWAAAEALVLGRGGITAVATATGLQRATVRVGVRELQTGPTANTETSAATIGTRRVRAPGGGRKPLTTQDPTLVRDLEALVEPVTRGTRCRPCVGPARVRVNWRPSWCGRGTASATRPWRSCCMHSTTACKAPA